MAAFIGMRSSSKGFSSAGIFENYLSQRELGMQPKAGSMNTFMKALYISMDPCTAWDGTEGLRNAAPGGIFNLEFSLDGSLLVAACEKRSILMFDPLSRKLVNNVDNAHNDCVNCVRFLDSRVFATCSDDSTVALWDARNLKSRIRTLNGHSNWVKNIEFSHSDGLLVTSGFDGSIFTWDINSYTETGFVYNRVFHTNGLMRTRLNPDASKMIICTTGGYLILIHDLDLRTLAQDLDGFKPNMYRLMQLSQTTIPVAANFTHLFSKKRKKNRIEFLTDFPEGDDAEVVSSLQVHPQGWCALSRNISNDENSEWTCVHDIQELDGKSDDETITEEENSPGEESDTNDDRNRPSSPDNEMVVIGLNSSRSRVMESLAGRIPRRTLRRQNAFRGFRPGTDRRRPSSGYSRNTTDVWEALVALREARALRERRGDRSGVELESRLRIFRMHSGIEDATREGPALAYYLRNSVSSEDTTYQADPTAQQDTVDDTREGPQVEREYHFVEEGAPGRQVTTRSFYIISRPARTPQRIKVPKNHKIQQNTARLTHYIEESNVGKGFIKELCFSSDGRLICSPFGYGVRLLTFSPDCSELSQCVPKEGPVKLNELSTNVCHSDIVVSTKFSPRHTLLVSGCLSGRIVWHQPVV